MVEREQAPQLPESGQVFRAEGGWYYYLGQGKALNLQTRQVVPVEIRGSKGLVYGQSIDSLNAMQNPQTPLIPKEIIKNIPVREGLHDPRQAQGGVVYFGEVNMRIVE